MTVIYDGLSFCKNCNSDPFTKNQKCLNFDYTLEQFHIRQGHTVVPYLQRQESVTELFTKLMNNTMPQNISELKNILKNNIQYDVEKTRTVYSDHNEFRNNAKGGFYLYEQKNSTQHFAKDLVSDIMLPAHVYDGKESCGKWKIIGCLETHLHSYGGGYVKKTIQHCNHKGCKVCATNTIKREAQSITNRLMTFCNLKRNRKIYLKENRSRILLHIIVSIPYEEHSLYLSKDGRKSLRTKAIKHLKELDIDGGVMIDHPYRFSEGLDSARLSPHLHLIVTGWLDGKKVKDLYERTNWIITNVSTIESWQDCYGLSKYLLSHSAVFLKEEGKRSSEHSVRYFGECHNKKFKVEDILQHSITGKDQIDSILYQRKEIEKKGIALPLQKVSYTHSIIHKSIKDATNQYYESTINGDVFELSKELRQYIKPHTNSIEDNPAIAQSDPPSMEFLQMRFDYGASLYDIVQSVYVTILFDTSLDRLCPECSIKMETLVPSFREKSELHHSTIAGLLADIPEDTLMPIDDVTVFDYLKDTGVSLLGMQFFDYDGMIQYDNGVYSRPECLDDLNITQYCTIVKCIEVQKSLYQYKLNNGTSMSKDERDAMILCIKNQYNVKPLDAF